MKLIIEIPEQMYLNAKADTLCGADNLVSAIKNGTPLPKGHGRLIDADKLIQEYRTSNIVSIYGEQIVKKVYRAPTIIEADRSEE